jgi:DNA helicase-2/ATP-dependent DNA helicase PcrA
MESRGRIENVQELKSNILGFLEQDPEDATLSGFLNEIALYTDLDSMDDDNCVTMMTVHAAKGLEFPVVYVVGMEEGIFPGTQCFSDPEEMGEERRLAYVAITRAKERLFLSCSQSRLLYGRTQANPVSRFAAQEIPAALLQEEQDNMPYFGAARGAGARPAPGIAEPYAPQKKQRVNVSPEFLQRAFVAGGETGKKTRLEKFAPGDRVKHAMYGAGQVLSARDMGGDVLYEVSFDNGQTKKLMATYARLTRE